MKISVIGMDKDELLSGKKLVEMGNEVIYVCKDYEHVNNVRKGHYNYIEKEILKDIPKKQAVEFTANLKEALEESVMCFIAESDKHDIFNILANAKEVGANMTGHTFIIDRANIPINREKHIKETIKSELEKRGATNLTFEVISDPNFLRN